MYELITVRTEQTETVPELFSARHIHRLSHLQATMLCTDWETSQMATETSPAHIASKKRCQFAARMRSRPGSSFPESEHPPLQHSIRRKRYRLPV